VALAKALKDRDIDLIDCSSGGIKGDSNMPMVPRVPGFQVAFSDRVRRDAGLPTIAVGLIIEARQAEDILQTGKADMVALARELLWHADWPAHAAVELGVADAYGIMPEEYAHRLRQREQAKAMPINQGGAATVAAFERHLGDGVWEA